MVSFQYLTIAVTLLFAIVNNADAAPVIPGILVKTLEEGGRMSKLPHHLAKVTTIPISSHTVTTATSPKVPLTTGANGRAPIKRQRQLSDPLLSGQFGVTMNDVSGINPF
ncbi:hypothetical protein BDF22DRAFT_652454 [Syncephalis plumigaleata]|nr:hypothetical protein BDF22DRAFT_652454 [Syncephalis plumigaleata]